MILLIATFTLFQTTATANPTSVTKKEFTKTIKKEFGITADGTTSIYNKYGQINLQTWDKSRVKIEVTILVNAGSESEAQEVFERIDVDFSNGNDYVKAETEIESQKSGWWSWGDNKSDYNISYKVFLPATNNIDIINKYGNVNAEAIEGSATVAVKYGNFRLEGIGENATINLGYGNGTVVAARDVTSEISYGRILFKEAKELSLTSKYSKVTIDKANDIRSETKYDTYDIGEVRDFRNNGKYDSFNIEYADNIVVGSKYTEVYAQKVGNSLDFDLEYGGATVEKVAKGFADIRIVGSYADFKINVEDGASYRMEATANYAGIRYPEDMNVTYEKEKGTYHEVEGHKGTKGARSVIKARLDYGGLKVRQN
ncbi:MAG: hypothetical protein AB8G22_02920 [Saprospiraceae bacterium]